MSGKYKGCAAIIQKKFPLATYSHCCSHVLNLAVVSACRLVPVQNLFSMIDKVYKFFDNHPKRQYTLNTFCETERSMTSGKLKSLCRTRWLQRIDAFHIFMELFDSIVESFDHITVNSSSWSKDAIVDAATLSKAMLNFEFIITLHTVERYMSYMEGLTRSLQARALDLLHAVQNISTLKQVLKDTCSHINTNFHCIFESASSCAQKYDVPLTIPRRCTIQSLRANHPGDTSEEYYRRSLAIPFLDHLTIELKERFTPHSTTALRCVGIVPSCFASKEKANDDELVQFFSSIIAYPSAAKAELELWRSHFQGQDLLPETPQAALQHADPLAFPNVRTMLINVMVLPVTTCEAERTFSALRRIKTYLRTTMKQDRLNGVALLNVHTANIPLTADIRSEFFRIED